MRTIQGCINCGDEREITSHGLCQKCLMRQRREKERESVFPDRSQKRYIAEITKQLQDLVKLNKLVSVDLVDVFSDQDATVIKGVTLPYTVERLKKLNPAAEPDEDDALPDNVNPEGHVNSASQTSDAEPELAANDAVEANVNPGEPAQTVNANSEVNVNRKTDQNVETEPTVDDDFEVDADSEQSCGSRPEELKEA